MNTHNSVIQKLNHVTFPEFQSDRIYMREFTRAAGLPKDIKRWQPTVDQMLANIQTPGSIFIMVEQSRVRQGEHQRRPGLHVDLEWGDAGGSMEWENPESRWKNPSQCATTNQTIVLASNVTASRAFVGKWQGPIGDNGDCSHVDTSGLEEILLEKNYVYAGDAIYTLHETLPAPYNCFRTIVRLHANN